VIANSRIRLIYLVLCVVGIAFAATSPASQPASDSSAVPASQDASYAANAAQDPNDRLPVANPFQYRIPPEANGFVSAPQVTIPAGIKLLAIMVVENREPLAVLQVPGMVDVLYIEAGDIIGVETPVKNSQRTTGTSSGRLATENGLVYLKIEEITSQQVVLHPQENPAGRRILR
jgi:hypothetical protein